MTTTTPATALAAEHDNFAMFSDAGGALVADLVLKLRAAGITHRRGEVLHADALAALDRLASFHPEATDTAVREAIAHAIAEPETERERTPLPTLLDRYAARDQLDPITVRMRFGTKTWTMGAAAFTDMICSREVVALRIDGDRNMVVADARP